MKKFTLILCLLCAVSLAKAAPVSGTFIIPGSTYATIAAAFTDLNNNGVSGACVFLINANYSETALNLTLSVPTASATFPITFKMDPAQTGANPKIIVPAGTAGATDGGIIIAGTDYVTFEKLDIDASAQTTIEWGYALVKRQNVAPFDGCQHVTIKGCNITLNKSNTKATGIYSGNHIATATSSLSITATTDACNDCQFDNNAISNVYIGISLNGFSALTPYITYDHNNEVGQFGGNVISNFGGANTAAYGIYVTNQDFITVMNNTISGSAGSTNRLAGILLQAGVSSSAEVAYNNISVACSTTGSSSTYGIWNLLGSTAASNTVSFHHNTIRECSSTITTASGPLYGILTTASAETININDNIIYGSVLGTTGAQSVIRSEASANNVNIYNNQIYNISNTGTGGLTIIHNQSSVNASIYSNTIYNCTANGGSVYGIYSALGTNVSIFKNNLYNISSNGGNTASSLVYGINNSSTTNITIYNNFISDLKANMATNNPAICGMYLTGGSTNNVFYNTVFLNAVGSGASFGSAAIYAGTAPTTFLRNNIFVNVSVPGAGGYTVAYRRSSPAIGTYSSTSNNNDFYAGTASPNNLIYYDGTTPIPALADYKEYVSPIDAASFTEIPPFVNSVTTPFNLHIQTGVATLCESGGSVVATPAITDDFDSNPRFPNIGYPDNAGQLATAPDVGADEYAGGPLPSVTFNVDMSTCSGFIPGTDQVYIAGNFPGATWNEPGTNPALLMTRIGVTYTYSLTMTLSPGTYEYKYFRNAGWGGGEWIGGSNRSITNTGTVTLNDVWGGSVNWANLQWPGTGSITLGGAYVAYAQAYIGNGYTAAAGATYGLQAWIGYSTSNTNPNTWTNWVPAPFLGQAYDNDEFSADLGASITSAGTYYYASRFRFGNGAYVYGGFNGGFWDGTANISGVLTVSASSRTLNLTSLFLEGLDNGSAAMRQAYDGAVPKFTAPTADQITVELHDAANYANIVKSFPNVNLSTSGTATITFPSSPAYYDSYYVTVRHRNSIETTTAAAVSFAGSTVNVSFGALSSVYGGNLKLMTGGNYAVYAGDVNQDGTIDTGDFTSVDNDASNYLSGYLLTDVNGDGAIDTGDFTSIDNNGLNYVSTAHP